VNPRYISFRIKLVKEFHQESIIVQAEVDHTKTTFFFRETDIGPGSFGGVFSIKISPTPKTMLSVFV
jgi:hypothetical protein